MAIAVALLRGINVGGAKKVPMARLRDLLAEAGFGAVRTYVQSGNVVLDAGERAPAEVAAAVEDVIERGFGFSAAVTVRTREELAAVVAANPFGASAEEGRFHHAVFLDGPLDPSALDGLDPDAFAPERFALIGRELHLHLPEGMGRSRLAEAALKRPVAPIATARNWRTVLALLAMAEEAAAG